MHIVAGLFTLVAILGLLSLAVAALTAAVEALWTRAGAVLVVIIVCIWAYLASH